MTVLDASVLIAHLDGGDAHHAAAKLLLTSVADDELLVHPMTLAEVLVGPIRAGKTDVALAALAALEVAEREPGPGGAVRLAQLRVGTGLKLPDCCVLVAAVAARGPLATFDVRLARAARDLGIAVLPHP